jgi:hypothetical protein
MHTRVKDVFGDNDLCVGECGVRRRLVADLPVEDVVVGLALDVIANDRRIGIEGPSSVDDGRQRLVFDVDQLQRVPRRVAVVCDDEGDLLSMEAHLVGGEHGHHVMGKRRYPGKLQ